MVLLGDSLPFLFASSYLQVLVLSIMISGDNRRSGPFLKLLDRFLVAKKDNILVNNFILGIKI